MKRLFLVLILCLALSAVSMAQDAPEATAEATVEAPPPVEVTAEPTLPPTEAPTIEATVEPTTEVPTVEATEEPVVEVTAEPTVEAPPEVTAEPTTEVPPVVIAPEPPIALLFADNFESGDYTPWIGGAGWITLPGQMQAIDSNEPLTLVSGVYFNAVAMARVQFTSGSAQVGVRSSGPLGYTAAVDSAGSVTLSRAGVPVGSAVVPVSGPWTDIRLSAIGSVVRVAVNGVEVIVWNDDAPLPPGSVTISANFAPRIDPAALSDTLTVEDFALFVPVEELPPPTVESPVVEVTQEPVVEATAEVPLIEATAEPTQEVGSGSEIFAAVNPPVLKAPADTSFVNTPRPTLSWFASPGANRYRVDINTAEDFTGTDILINKETPSLSLALSAANLPIALTQDKFYWRVQAHDKTVADLTTGWSAESDVWEFTVDLAKMPNNNIITTATTTRPTFTWTSASVTTPEYIVQVDDNADFSSPVYTLPAPISGLSHQIPAANALAWGNYYWRVIVSGDTPDAASGIGNTFTVSPAAARVTLIAPTNNLLTYDNTWGFDWTPVPVAALGGPFEYQIQVNTVNNFNGALFINQTVVPDNYDHPTPLPDGKYWWRVRPVNDYGVGTWSSVWSFTVDRVAKPLRPLACTTDTTPTFGWDKVPGATRYNLLVDNDDNFSSPVINFTSANANGVSYTPPAINALLPAIYYWRVDFSFDPGPTFTFVPAPTVATFCVTPAFLKAPTLISPANNAIIMDTTLPPLDWTDVVDPSTFDVDYRIQVATTANFSAASILINDVIEDSTLDEANPRLNGNYWWRVKTVNYLGAESTAWSAIRKFTLDTVPPSVPPVLTAPACGSTTTNNRPIFSWGSVPTAVKYQIQVDTHNPPTSMIIVTTSRTYQPPAQLLYTTWNWRVRAVDAATNIGPWSDSVNPICSLIVNSATGVAPVPNRFTDNTPTLTWTPISWADTYTVEIYKSSTVSAANLLRTITGIPGTATSVEVTPLLDNGTYYWRVRAEDTVNGSGNWSGPALGIFQVEAP